MAKTASIKTLARQFAHETMDETALPRAAVNARLYEIPPTLWDEIENARHRVPRFAYALARVAQEIARHKKNIALSARAELALIQTLNALGEFPDTLALCEKTAARFEKIGEAENTARVWLEAAWAESQRGNLDTAREFRTRAIRFARLSPHRRELETYAAWIRARIWIQQGAFPQAHAQLLQMLSHSATAGTETLDVFWRLDLGRTQARTELKAAPASLAKVRAQFERMGYRVERIWCDYYLAQAFMDLTRFALADARLQTVLSFAQKNKMRFLAALCLLEQGRLAWYQQNFEKARVVTLKARTLFEELGVIQEVSTCDLNIGYYLQELNQYAQAIPFFEQALRIAQATARHSKAGVCHQNLAQSYTFLGDYERALQHHFTARDLFTARGMKLRLVECEIALGQTFFQCGQFEKAAQAWQRARRLAQTNKIPLLSAHAELWLGRTALRRGQSARVRRQLTRARGQFQKLGLEISVAYCERLLAQTNVDARPAALQMLDASAKKFARQKLFVEVALCELTRADLYCAWQEWNKAERAYRRAQKILEPAFPDHAWRIAYGLGKIARARGDETRALNEWLRGCEMIATLRGEIGIETWSNDLFHARRKIFDAALQMAARLKRADAATRVIEIAKAQSFLQQLARRELRAPHTDALQTKLVERLDALGRAAMQQRKQLFFNANETASPSSQVAPAARAQALKTYRATLDKFETLAERVRVARRGMQGSPTLAPFDLEKFRAYANARWGQAWTALDYAFANGSLYIACIEPTRVTVTTTRWTMADRIALEQATSTHPDMRELIYNGTLHGHPAPARPNVLAHLAARLLPETLCGVKDTHRLLLSPHAQLHQLPFHALPWQGAPLLEKCSVAYAPNLQTLVELARGQTHKRARDKILVCGVETFQDARPLAYTRREIAGIARTQESVTDLSGTKATRENFLALNQRGALAQYDILHFATHAIVETDAPHTSRILLAQAALNILDITVLNLDARLVTLSACASATAQGGSGDEWLGLVRAFFYAGARAIVASLWNVDDASTTALMKLFYRNLEKRESIAEALRHAQLALYRQGLSAYHWAPFVAHGEV